MEVDVPLIIRGQVIDDFSARFETRRGAMTFRTADVNAYFDQLVLRNPIDLQDLYTVSLDEILDYLDELGRRLAPATNPHIRKAQEISLLTAGHTEAMLHTVYENMRHSLRRDFVEEAVRENIGFDCLEGWQRRVLHDREVRVRAFGARAVHLNAGNAPAVALHGIINGSVLRCDNIVKAPSNDPYTATAIALTMIEMAPDHPITRHLSVAYWKGGDTAFEKRLYRPINLEKIIAWGGFASMGHIRSYLGPGMDLIALDPKISASIIGREVFESEQTMTYVAQQMARDIGTMNQEGCVNTRMVYVECALDDASIARLNRLGELTYEAIQALDPAISSVHPAFDPVLRQEINGLRHVDYYRIFGGKATEGAVIVSQESEPIDFSERLGCRVINMVPYATIREAIDQVTVDTQTLAVYPAARIPEIADQCAWRGAQRLTPVGCATYLGIAYPHDSIEMMRRIARWVVIEDYSDEVIREGAGFVHGAKEAREASYA